MSDRACGIAVDGGGTKTEVVCHAFDKEGTVLGRFLVGATNPNSVTDAVSQQRLKEGIENALREAGRECADVREVTLGLSGVDRPADLIKVQKWMRELFPHLVRPEKNLEEYDDGCGIRVCNDGTVAFASGTKGVLHGVVVISGTGTISIAFHDGKSIRASGMGPLLGDVGCGFDIARRALKAACYADDGRGPETMLRKELLDFLQLKKVEEFIPWIYDMKTFSWDKIAKLAPVVQKCAEAGDPVAVHIFEKNAAGLVNTISTVAKRMGFKEDEEFPIVYSGGLLSSGVLVPYLTPLLQAKWKNAKIVIPKVNPVMGAVYLNLLHHK